MGIVLGGVVSFLGAFARRETKRPIHDIAKSTLSFRIPPHIYYIYEYIQNIRDTKFGLNFEVLFSRIRFLRQDRGL